MHKTVAEAKTLVGDFLLEIGKFDEAEIVLCPPFTALQAVSELLATHANVRLGAQNVHEATHGAFTGEISAAMLRELFCRYVIVGHSERRQYYGETDALIAKKAKAALTAGVKPIICVGESLAQREAGQWKEVLAVQTQGSLAGFSEKEAPDIVVAYEPVWAIGTGKNATPDQAQEAQYFIRQELGKLFPGGAAERIRIQYGGSVKPENAMALFKQPDIDGALVGGASLEARSFAAIVKALSL